MNRLKATLIVIAALLFNAACSYQVNPISGNKRAYGYSWQEEKEIGQNADKEIQAQYGVVQDQALVNYVSEIGEELVQVSHFNREDTPDQYRDTDFVFRVLDSPVVNAFALPGGYVYVTRGLMTHLDNEAQLSVVLGHEIGHVIARHASQRAVEQQVGQVAILGGAILGESVGLNGQRILNLSSTTAQLLFLSYSRDDERESDKLGVEYSSKKGYEASEGSAFFESLKRISESSGQSIPTLLSSHPDPGEREETIPQLASEWEQEGYELTKIDEAEYMQEIEGMIFGENPRNGYVENNTFYHPELEFQFPVPSGFNVQNQPTAVILFNDDQNAVTQFTIDSENNSARSSVNAILSQEGVNPGSQGQDRVNGLPAYSAQASAQTEDGTAIQLLITAIEFQGNVYQFLSYTSSDMYSNYEDEFSMVASGFNEVNDQSVLNVRPVTLKVVKVSNAAPFSELLPNTLPGNTTPEEVAILNQVQLDENIAEGEYIKIPVQ